MGFFNSALMDTKPCLATAIITLHPQTPELIWEKRATLNSVKYAFPFRLLLINQHFKIWVLSILDKPSFQKITQLRRHRQPLKTRDPCRCQCPMGEGVRHSVRRHPWRDTGTGPGESLVFSLQPRVNTQLHPNGKFS